MSTKSRFSSRIPVKLSKASARETSNKPDVDVDLERKELAETLTPLTAVPVVVTPPSPTQAYLIETGPSTEESVEPQTLNQKIAIVEVDENNNFIVPEQKTEAALEVVPVESEIQTWKKSESEDSSKNYSSSHSVCCAASFPIVMVEPEPTSSNPATGSGASGDGDGDCQQQITSGEKYPTRVIHGPLDMGDPGQSREQSNDSLHVGMSMSQSQSQYQCGGLVIEEITSGSSEQEHNQNANSNAEGTQEEAPIPIPLPAGPGLVRPFETLPTIPEDVTERVSSISNRNLVHDETQRLPSFHTVSKPSSSTSRCMACFNDGLTTTKAVKASPNPSRSPTPATSGKKRSHSHSHSHSSGSRLPKPVKPMKQRPRTYEEVFLMKKMLQEKGPAALRSFNRETISYSPKAGRVSLHTEQKAILTKTLTKTITEYEVDDEGRHRKVRTRTKSKTKPPTPAPPRSITPERSTKPEQEPEPELPTPPVPKKRQFKPKKVTILEEPTSVTIHTPPSGPPPDPKPQSEVAIPARMDLDENGPDRIVVLPGHRDPVMAVPPVRSPGEDSGAELEILNSQRGRRDSHCKKCKLYKKLFIRSEDTVRYLTELLGIKDTEITKLSMSSGQNENGNQLQLQTPPLPTTTPPPQVNPLLSSKTAPESETQAAALSERPRFDIDNFIQKFFRQSLLCSQGFGGVDINPFDKLQVFRLCICMRDCVTTQAMNKLKEGYQELQKGYETLISGKTLDSTWEEDEVKFVLDSYKRFIKLSYYYMKDSMRLIEGFEEKTIPIYITPDPVERGKKKQPYFVDTTMTLNGQEYIGTFIPFKAVPSPSPPSTQHKQSG